MTAMNCTVKALAAELPTLDTGADTVKPCEPFIRGGGPPRSPRMLGVATAMSGLNSSLTTISSPAVTGSSSRTNPTSAV